MTATHLDRLLTADLKALATDCRRDLLPIEATLAEGAYRDPRPGAELRRDELAGQRRAEIAALVRSLVPVFAHRVARIATGTVALVTGFATAMTFRDDAIVAEPGFTLPALAVLHAMVYFGALGLASVRFRGGLERTAATRGDVYAQLDQLAVSPLDVARASIQRLAGASVGLAIAGAGALAMTLRALVSGETSYVPALGADARPIDLLFGPDGLALAIGFAAIAATVIGGACHRARDPHALPSWLRTLGRPAAAALGVALPVVIQWGLALPFNLDGVTEVPSPVAQLGFAFGNALAIVLVATAVIVWRFRREAARVHDA